MEDITILLDALPCHTTTVVCDRAQRRSTRDLLQSNDAQAFFPTLSVALATQPTPGSCAAPSLIFR